MGKPSRFTDLKERLSTGSLVVVAMFLVTFLSFYPFLHCVFILAIAAMVGVAQWEYFRLVKAKGFQPSVTMGITLAVCLVGVVAFSSFYAPCAELPWFFLILCLFLCLLRYFKQGDDPLVNTAVTLFGIIYIAAPLALMIKIRYFPFASLHIGAWWFLYLIFVTKVTDVAALFIGRRFGRRKLATSLSPEKTLEGAIAGIIASILCSVAFVYIGQSLSWTDSILSFSEAFVAGAILSIAGQIGDLAESMLKRDAGVKDSNRLPGLGGLLDMLDSLLFTTPIVYLLMKVKWS